MVTRGRGWRQPVCSRLRGRGLAGPVTLFQTLSRSGPAGSQRGASEAAVPTVMVQAPRAAGITEAGC